MTKRLSALLLVCIMTVVPRGFSGAGSRDLPPRCRRSTRISSWRRSQAGAYTRGFNVQDLFSSA
jgi:hypothetical protein